MIEGIQMMTKNQSTSNREQRWGTSIRLGFSRYSSFVRIGSGLSFADYIWVRDKPWKVWDPKSPPSFFQTAKGTQEDKGDLYLEPEEYRCRFLAIVVHSSNL
jgi:hypothetical protein